MRSGCVLLQARPHLEAVGDKALGLGERPRHVVARHHHQQRPPLRVGRLQQHLAQSTVRGHAGLQGGGGGGAMARGGGWGGTGGAALHLCTHAPSPPQPHPHLVHAPSGHKLGPPLQLAQQALRRLGGVPLLRTQVAREQRAALLRCRHRQLAAASHPRHRLGRYLALHLLQPLLLTRSGRSGPPLEHRGVPLPPPRAAAVGLPTGLPAAMRVQLGGGCRQSRRVCELCASERSRAKAAPSASAVSRHPLAFTHSPIAGAAAGRAGTPIVAMAAEVMSRRVRRVCPAPPTHPPLLKRSPPPDTAAAAGAGRHRVARRNPGGAHPRGRAQQGVAARGVQGEEG